MLYIDQHHTVGITGDKFKSKGTELAEDQLNQMSKQLEAFQTNLEEFASNHKSMSVFPVYVQLYVWAFLNNVGIQYIYLHMPIYMLYSNGNFGIF